MMVVKQYNTATGHVEPVATLPDDGTDAGHLSAMTEAQTMADIFNREDTETDHTYFVTEEDE
jgi:hypothetical protein